MNKKVILSLLGIFTAVVLLIIVGLGFSILTKPHSFNDIITNLKEMKNYKSDITIEVANDMQKITYKGKQTCKATIGYKLELSEGRTFIFKGDEITVKDEGIGKEYSVDKSFDEVFKYCFIGEYIGLMYTNEESNYKKENIDDKEFLLIEMLIPGSNRNLSKGVMYVSMKDNLPKKLVIYDNKDKERIVCTYENFNWTEKIEDAEF